MSIRKILSKGMFFLFLIAIPKSLRVEYYKAKTLERNQGG